MELASQDTLRLNVLLRQNLQALRIDESRMQVIGLTDDGEKSVQLNPNCQDETYLKLVRQLISSHVLGSPGGYPVYIKRWTRMGQARSTQIDKLLLLGEPEAVTAAVYTPEISPELARRAWWCSQSSENARELLRRPAIVADPLGRELAAHLLEFLPFETEARDVMNTVALILQPGLLEPAQREKLWKQGQRKNAYRAGFLLAGAEALPERRPARKLEAEEQQRLEQLAEQGNLAARRLQRAFSEDGQTFLTEFDRTCEKLADQDVTIALFNRLGQFLQPRIAAMGHRHWAELEAALEEPDATVQALLDALPGQQARIQACERLAQVNENLLDPIFGGSDALGSVMRKQLKPVMEPLRTCLKQLIGG